MTGDPVGRAFLKAALLPNWLTDILCAPPNDDEHRTGYPLYSSAGHGWIGGRGVPQPSIVFRERTFPEDNLPSRLLGAGVESGQLGADLIGLRHTEVGVEGQGLLVVVTGFGGVA